MVVIGKGCVDDEGFLVIAPIEPGRNPGGLWARTVTRSGQVLADRAFNLETAQMTGEVDAAAAGEWLRAHPGDTVSNVVFDGDTGEVMSVFGVTAAPQAASGPGA